MRPGSILLAAIAAAVVPLAGCSSKQATSSQAAAPAVRYEGVPLSPTVVAPPLATLHNYQGQRVSLASYRGKAVLVTFLYTHCPDVCPLIAANLHNTLSALGGRAHDVQLIAVSVDPHGDTPRTVAAFLRAHGLRGEMQYLTGSGRELAPVWSAWHVGSERDVGNPRLVNHSALIYGVSASGRLTTIYDASFRPSEIIHDLPGLLSS